MKLRISVMMFAMTALVCSFAGAADSPRKPNVVVILADDK